MSITNREPNFNNIVAILQKKVPQRPTLFEFFLNEDLYHYLVKDMPNSNNFSSTQRIVHAFQNAGYDYATVRANTFMFPTNEVHSQSTRSLNDGAVIYDRVSFEKYKVNFKTPNEFSTEEFLKIPEYLPHGMKVIPCGPGGVLENVISLVGYEDLCMMIYDDEQLVYDIFEFVGKAILDYYKLTLPYDFVGAVISNDDWGFNTQTMLSPNDMRKFVFPWHKEITSLIHAHGKYAILHSCGYYHDVIDDVINDMNYDARHSYEDNIVPVENAYHDFNNRIAVLGGIDMNYLCTETPENISKRAENLLNISCKKGGYALGSGNSIANYVPIENYFAMTSVVFDK